MGFSITSIIVWLDFDRNILVMEKSYFHVIEYDQFSMNLQRIDWKDFSKNKSFLLPICRIRRVEKTVDALLDLKRERETFIYKSSNEILTVRSLESTNDIERCFSLVHFSTIERCFSRSKFEFDECFAVKRELWWKRRIFFNKINIPNETYFIVNLLRRMYVHLI